MARGVRKSPMERLQSELKDVKASMVQYENSLETLREKEKMLEGQIQMEEFKVVNEILKEQDMTMDDLKEMLSEGRESVS